MSPKKTILKLPAKKRKGPIIKLKIDKPHNVADDAPPKLNLGNGAVIPSSAEIPPPSGLKQNQDKDYLDMAKFAGMNLKSRSQEESGGIEKGQYIQSPARAANKHNPFLQGPNASSGSHISYSSVSTIRIGEQQIRLEEDLRKFAPEVN